MEALAQFQPTAKALRYAFEQGYLDKAHFHRETSSGNSSYDWIRVNNGLSYKGTELLTTD